jgi:polysaccharide export outer membrane protein
MFTAARRFTVRMAIPALVLLCLNGIAESAEVRQRQPENGHATSNAAGDPAGQDSALETSFSHRAGKTLHLFGYEIFATTGTASPPAFGTAQNDYLLGPGDEVRVTIRGGKYDSNRRYTVNSNGDVIVDQLRPLTAAGRTLGICAGKSRRKSKSPCRHMRPSCPSKGCERWASS